MIGETARSVPAATPLFDRRLKEERDYWLARLAPPAEAAGAGIAAGRGAKTTARTVVRLDRLAAVEPALARLAGSSHFLRYAAGLAAVAVCLHRLSGHRRVAVGSPAFQGSDEQPGDPNALVVLLEIAPERTFRELLLQVRETLLAAYSRQGYPFARLVADLGLERTDGRCPLFDVAVSMAGIHGEMPEVGQAVTVGLSPAGGFLSGRLVAAPGRLRQIDLLRFAEHLQSLLRTVLERHGSPLADLDPMDEAERHQVLREWNDTRRTLAGGARSARIDRLIRAQIERTPDAVAVVAEGEALSYRELGARSARLADHLCRLGVGPDVPVGICLERSLELLLALVGTLEAGGAYVPLDPGYPRERLELMLADSGAPVVLTAARLAANLPESGARAVLLDGSGAVDLARPAAGAMRDGEPREHAGDSADHLAYVIYTSGSTGRPKGAMNSHRAVANRLLWMREEYGLSAGDRVLQKTPVSFDVSVWELFLPLVTGAAVVMARPGAHRDSAQLAAVIRREAVTTLHFVPSMLRVFLEEEDLAACVSLRRVFASGEALPLDLAARFHAARRAELHNLYGPTEAAVDVTCWPSTPADRARGTVPIGRPIANLRIHLLDGELRPVSAEAVGDLYIGGAGLARGYHARADLTADRFVPDPVGEEPGARLYRTGDRARRAPDGALEFLGRTDDQVKIRGLRVELGEIEAAIRSHPAVREAAVAAREERPGDVRLAAYAVLRPGAALSPAELRGFLAAKLPEPLLPAAIVWLPALPLGPSGKLDRRALPAPDDRRAGGRSPESPTEWVVALAWERVLGLREVGAEDDFVAVGGHSLLATQVAARLRSIFRIELPVARLFERRTVRALAAEVAGLGGGAEICDGIARLFLAVLDAGDRPEESLPAAPTDLLPPARFAEFERLVAAHGLDVAFAGGIPRRSGVGPSPLSLSQEALWYADQVERGSVAYNLLIAVRIAGPLDPAVLARAVAEIARRHESLRTTFETRGGIPLQVASAPSSIALPAVDLAHLPAAARDAEAGRLALQEARRPFDLEADRLVRLALLRLAGEEHVAALAMHHIVSDGWSMGIFVRELAALYGAFSRGGPSPLPEPAIQYRDFAAWQREHLQGDVLAAHLDYWRRQLAGAPARLRLPTDRPRPAVQTSRGAVLSFALHAPLASALRALGRAEGATLFMVLLAGFDALLGAAGGQDDVVVGTFVANRRQREVEGSIGFFVNTLVLRTRLSGGPTCRELLGRVRETTLGAYAHQDLPFSTLVQAMAPERDLSRNPLFQVVLSLDNFPLPEAAGAEAGLTMEMMPIDGGASAKFDLALELREVGEELDGLLTFDVDLFEPSTAARLLAQYRAVLQQMAADPDRAVSSLSLATAGDHAASAASATSEATAAAVADFNSDLEELA